MFLPFIFMMVCVLKANILDLLLVVYIYIGISFISSMY